MFSHSRSILKKQMCRGDDVAVPDFQSLLLPFLREVADEREHNLSEVRHALADKLNLSAGDKKELLPSGRQTRFSNRTGWVSTHLRKAGPIESSGRGRFRITDRGLEVIRENPDRLDMSYLEQYPEYREFRGIDGPKDLEGQTDRIQTPEEQLESAYAKLKRQLATELLEQVRSSSPDFFEEIVLDVLVAMGYGGSVSDAQKVGRSGDGGIDGIIKEDKLGLDLICIQAKRWQNPVGVSTVREFVGSLVDQKTRKGVLITTSSFSNEAIKFAERVGNTVLVDGEKLAELMIEHNVGVSEVATYKIYRIDSDYFEEET